MFPPQQVQPAAPSNASDPVRAHVLLGTSVVTVGDGSASGGSSGGGSAGSVPALGAQDVLLWWPSDFGPEAQRTYSVQVDVAIKVCV